MSSNYLDLLNRYSTRRIILIGGALLLSFYVFLLMKYFKKKSHFISSKPDIFTASDNLLLFDIQWAVRKVSKLIYWEYVCRHQAYLVTILCRIYRIQYQIFIGTKINQETNSVEGHVWTTSNGIFLSGACNVEEFQIIQTF